MRKLRGGCSASDQRRHKLGDGTSVLVHIRGFKDDEEQVSSRAALLVDIDYPARRVHAIPHHNGFAIHETAASVQPRSPVLLGLHQLQFRLRDERNQEGGWRFFLPAGIGVADRLCEALEVSGFDRRSDNWA